MRDEFDDTNDDGSDRPRRRNTDYARVRAAGPGIVLTILGAFGILTSIAFLIFTHNIGPYRDWIKSIEEKQPAGDTKEQLRRHIEQMEQADTPEGRTVNTLMYGGTLLTSLLVAVGGWKLRSLSGYPLALVGSVLAIIPFNGCCCLTTPFGIWAFVTLMNPEVKEAFGRATRRFDDEYDNR